MWKRPTRRPSPALVIACIALLVSLGGTGYATVLQVPRNSVGTLQLKRNAVKSSKIAPNTVRTGQVVDGSLLTADFKPGQIPQGPKGDKGDRGPVGPVGISGYEIVRTSRSIAANSVVVAVVASCPTGKKVLGGTQRVIGSGSSGVFFDAQVINDTVNVPGDRAYAVIVYNTNTAARTVEVLATCARVA